MLAFFSADGDDAEGILSEMRTVAKDHKGEVRSVCVCVCGGGEGGGGWV